MPATYICPNLGNCHKADIKETITLPTGAEPICPECQSKLIPSKPVIDLPFKKIVIVAGILLLIIGGFVLIPKLFKSDDSKILGTTLLRFQGSNTIGGKLLPALAEKFLAQEGYGNIHVIQGTKEDECIIEGEQNGTQGRIEIAAHGSKTAFESLKNGTCDIGMSSRPVKDDEWNALKPILGDLRSNGSEYVIALDGIAIIVHPSNPVSSLTISQIADIFSGRVTDWSQVGGQSGAITIFARDEKSGTWDFFKDTVLKKYGKTLATNSTRLEDGKKLSTSVANDPNAIGFIGLNYIGSNKALALSDVGVESRKPSQLTIKTEDYLLSRRLFLYAPESNKKQLVSRFIEFAIGITGQQIVATTGLVNLDPTPVTADPYDPRKMSVRWKALTNGATEIATRFRFRNGSETLDTRANRDIGRIVGVLSQPKYKNKKILLIGFADSAGSQPFNNKLAEKRAQVVAKELATEGVQFEDVAWLGAEAFVAPNDTPENREKNRRVEVWVK
jgi:phosphate transport system substrate-binding protein